jgi:hypothetical protein
MASSCALMLMLLKLSVPGMLKLDGSISTLIWLEVLSISLSMKMSTKIFSAMVGLKTLVFLMNKLGSQIQERYLDNNMLTG